MAARRRSISSHRSTRDFARRCSTSTSRATARAGRRSSTPDRSTPASTHSACSRSGCPPPPSSVDLPLAALPERGAQLELLQLARRGAGELGAEFDLLGALVAGELL